MSEIKNILVIMDLEGIIGVTNLKDEEKTEELLYKEIEIIVNAIPFEYNIYLCYEHNDGKFPNMIKNIKRNMFFVSKVDNVDFSINYYRSFLIGFHGRKFDVCKFPHTYRDEIDCIFLKNKEVGEIEIITNLLAFYGVEVTLISAEKIVIDNLDFDCCYHIVDDMIDNKIKYKELSSAVEKALLYTSTKLEYDKSKIKVIYDRDTLIFSRASKIRLQSEFKDTLDFCSNISFISNKLNRIAGFSVKFMLSEIYKMKPKSLDMIEENFVKEFFLMDIRDLNYYDLKLIYRYFRDKKL